jgi:hypothetical protein
MIFFYPLAVSQAYQSTCQLAMRRQTGLVVGQTSLSIPPLMGSFGDVALPPEIQICDHPRCLCIDTVHNRTTKHKTLLFHFIRWGARTIGVHKRLL